MIAALKLSSIFFSDYHPHSHLISIPSTPSIKSHIKQTVRLFFTSWFIIHSIITCKRYYNVNIHVNVYDVVYLSLCACICISIPKCIYSGAAEYDTDTTNNTSKKEEESTIEKVVNSILKCADHATTLFHVFAPPSSVEIRWSKNQNQKKTEKHRPKKLYFIFFSFFIFFCVVRPHNFWFSTKLVTQKLIRHFN